MTTRIAVGLVALLAAAQVVQALFWVWRSLPQEVLLLTLFVMAVMGLLAWGEWVRWLNRQPNEWRTFTLDRYLPLVMAVVGALLGVWSSTQ